MTGDETIGEAVRQLGRAVGSLARAVVGTVRRRSVPRPEPESGPPQAWLDLVAETDPEWLSRSRWADRAGTTAPRRRRGASTRTRLTEPVPRHQEMPVAPHVRSEKEPPPWRPVVDRAATRADVGPVEVATDGPVVESMPDVRPVPSARIQERSRRREATQRLLPVDAPTREDEEATAPVESARRAARLVGTTPSRVPAPAPAPERPPMSTEADPFAREVHHAPEPSSYRPSDPPRAPRLDVPQAPVAREHASHRSYGALAEYLRELPGTWPSRPAPEPSRPAERPQPTSAPAPTWPELPRTEALDDHEPLPAPGLAAVLWELDGRPDSLTTAQRRS